jgi:hypothetical protein
MIGSPTESSRHFDAFLLSQKVAFRRNRFPDNIGSLGRLSGLKLFWKLQRMSDCREMKRS